MFLASSENKTSLKGDLPYLATFERIEGSELTRELVAGCRGDITTRCVELRMIEDVRYLRIELELHTLCNRYSFAQGNVCHIEVLTFQTIRQCITKMAGLRNGECCRIEPIRDLLSARNIVGVPHQIR